MTDIKALKALAETVIGFNNLEEVDADLYEIAVEQFEAAVNPAAVLELTKEIEQARLIASLAYNFDGYKAVLRERDQLKAINTDLHATLQAAKGEIERLKAENESLRKETARYHFLAGKAWEEGRDGGMSSSYRFPSIEKSSAPYGKTKGFHYATTDDAIDAAMSKEAKP